MTHRRAVWTMVAAAMLWSVAGVVTRQLDAARSFEITFWRSGFNALALVLLLSWLRGPATLWRTLREGGRSLWLSGLCWAAMFTAFMLALTLTTVAHVLVTMAVAPLLTALLSRLVLGHRLAARTWAAIVLAGVGIGWMYGSELGSGNGGDPAENARHWLGTGVAMCVPIAAAINWALLHHNARADDEAGDMLPAVLIGGLISAALTLPLSLPFAASAHDLALLAGLGVFQLAIPCLMAVRASQVLSAPESSLLALLEVVFGVAWAWLGAGERPTAAVLGGGALVLGAMLLNEAFALHKRRPLTT
jgi:drug/metabolite transporter (DMT)-like permease